jgi:hypothetical protein
MFSRRCSLGGHGYWERKWESRAIVNGHVVLRVERVGVGCGSATWAERAGVVVGRPATCFHVVELHVVTVRLEKRYLVHNIVHVCVISRIRWPILICSRNNGAEFVNDFCDNCFFFVRSHGFGGQSLYVRATGELSLSFVIIVSSAHCFSFRCRYLCVDDSVVTMLIIFPIWRFSMPPTPPTINLLRTPTACMI